MAGCVSCRSSGAWLSPDGFVEGRSVGVSVGYGEHYEDSWPLKRTRSDQSLHSGEHHVSVLNVLPPSPEPVRSQSPEESLPLSILRNLPLPPLLSEKGSSASLNSCDSSVSPLVLQEGHNVELLPASASAISLCSGAVVEGQECTREGHSENVLPGEEEWQPGPGQLKLAIAEPPDPVMYICTVKDEEGSESDDEEGQTPAAEARASLERRRKSSIEFQRPWGQSEAGVPHRAVSVGSDSSEEVNSEGDDLNSAANRVLRRRSSYHLTSGHAPLELFLRLNHSRQTLDFAKRQAAAFAALDKGDMTIWEALDVLHEVQDVEAVMNEECDLDNSLSQRDHAFQLAELCRLTYPNLEWLPLVGLIHGLGKMLLHPRFGAQPHWSVLGETFPLGCRFATQIMAYQYFSSNPDRRRRVYNTPLGIYSPGIGLENVYMSWGASEYLYLVLLLNQTRLPPEALFLIRFHRCATLTLPAAPYWQLLNKFDQDMLPLLAAYQKLSAGRSAPPPQGMLKGQAFVSYYSSLIDKYLGPEPLSW